MTIADGASGASQLPAESETGIGDDPITSGPAADEVDPVIESEDGLSSEPVNGGVAPAGADPSVGPAMAPSSAEICAVVEFGYLGLLEGDSGADIQSRLRDGAALAAAAGDERYSSAGSSLLAAVGTDAMSSSADAFLGVCAADGFERLA